MRRFLLLAVILVLSSAPALADPIMQVNYWASYTATLPCSSNCTQTFALSFQFDPTWYTIPTDWYPLQIPGSVIPGTLFISSSGFMGDSFYNAVGRVLNDGTFTLTNTSGLDQFELHVGTITPGIDTVRGDMYNCGSCTTTMEHFFGFMPPTQQHSIVTVVPEPSVWIMLLITPFLLAFLGRRQDKEA